MGDRTWGRLFCRIEDRKEFEAALWMEPEGLEEPAPGQLYVELYDDEMSPTLDGVPHGRPYIFEHGAGIEYGPCETVCDEFETSEFPMGFDRGSYVINWVDRDNELERLAHHMRIRKRALEKIGLAELP